MRWTCLLIGLLILTFQPVHAGHKPPKIALRVHVQTTGEGQSPLEATQITIPPNNEQIFVRTLPEMTEADLIEVQQDPALGVRLFFNHVGRVNLNAVTAQNQGRILVILINGIVIYAPTIDEQLSNGELDIPRQLDPQIFRELQEVVQFNLRKAARN